MMYPRALPALLMLVNLNCGVFAAENHLPGRVLRVVDGDSLVLDVRGSQYRIELDEIDAPEPNQSWGPEAAAWLDRSLTGRFVIVRWRQTLASNQVGGRVLLGDRDVGLDLLHQGLAWCTRGPATTPSDGNPVYHKAEDAARTRRLGLWSDDAPIPPWEWRRAGAKPHR